MTMDIDAEDFLSHYGVKGMKWGVRKKRTKKETRAIDKRKQVKAKRRTLSDADLKAYIDRLEKEKKLKSLIEEDLTPGRKVAKKLLSEGGQKVLKTVGTGAALYAIKVGVESKFDLKNNSVKDLLKNVDPKDAAKYIVPNPNKK